MRHKQLSSTRGASEHQGIPNENTPKHGNVVGTTRGARPGGPADLPELGGYVVLGPRTGKRPTGLGIISSHAGYGFHAWMHRLGNNCDKSEGSETPNGTDRETGTWWATWSHMSSHKFMDVFCKRM